MVCFDVEAQFNISSPNIFHGHHRFALEVFIFFNILKLRPGPLCLRLATPLIRYITHYMRRPIWNHICWLSLVHQVKPPCPGGGGGGGGGVYSLYEGYYICSSVSTPLFQVSGKFVEFRPLYFSKNEENVVFWPLYFSKNEEMSYFDPYILAKMRKMSYFDPYFSSKLGKMYSFDPPFWPL